MTASNVKRYMAAKMCKIIAPFKRCSTAIDSINFQFMCKRNKTQSICVYLLTGKQILWELLVAGLVVINVIFLWPESQSTSEGKCLNTGFIIINCKINKHYFGDSPERNIIRYQIPLNSIFTHSIFTSHSTFSLKFKRGIRCFSNVEKC